MAEDCSQWTCSVCRNVGMQESDGFYYCLLCNSQAEDVMETGVADEDFIDKGGFGGGALYSQSFRRSRPQPATRARPLSQFDPQSQQFWTRLTQEEERVKVEKVEDMMMSPTEPSDFPSAANMKDITESYPEEVRKRYVMGLQMMIEAQCEALVNKFKVNPLICGIVGPIWLRYLAKSRVFSHGLAVEDVQDSVMQKTGRTSERASGTKASEEVPARAIQQRWKERNYHIVKFFEKEYSKDLHSFLKYCKDVVFAGLEPPLEFNREEKSLIDQFWQFYQKEKESEKLAEDDSVGVRVPEDKRNSVGSDLLEESIAASSSRCSDEYQNTCDSGSGCVETVKEEAIRRLKINMEENNFLYIPPRVNVKRLDYLHYVRKKDEGSLTYAAHADYYILLRACARVAEIDIRLMHVAVMSLERRLAWIEQRIEQCSHLSPTVTCENCTDSPSQELDTDPIGLSQLSL